MPSEQRSSAGAIVAAVPLALGLLAMTLDDGPGVTAPTALTVFDFSATPGEELAVCSFNIQFLGNSAARDNGALADVVENCDIVAVQELVSPPYEATFPDGTDVRPDPQAAEFFDEMKARDFEFWLSEEDTGTGNSIHRNGSSTEWWVTFYKPDRVSRAEDLPHGFLADDRSNHDDWERVPYAFSFRTPEGLDFVLVSVHLKPGGGSSNRARRKHELAAISDWIAANDDVEKDIVILGDMNLYTEEEIAEATPPGFLSLNNEAMPTNTNLKSPRPYDHVMYRDDSTSEVDDEFDMLVVNLIETMRPKWDNSAGSYPGDPYHHNNFRKFYSDHHPVVFKFKDISGDDD